MENRGYEMVGQYARSVVAEDYSRFDLILAMDSSNLRWLERHRPSECRAELGLYLEFAFGPTHGDVPDPYYSGQFDAVLDMIERAGSALVARLRECHGTGAQDRRS